MLFNLSETVKHLFFYFFFILVLIIFLPVKATAANDIIEKTENGSINWSKRIISSEGSGSPSTESTAPYDFSNNETLLAAEKHSISNLFDTLLKIRIDSTHRTGNFISKDSNLFSQLESMVMKSITVKKGYITDGTVNITKQFIMDGGFFQLILPSDIKQFEPVQTLSTNKSDIYETEAPYTGLILDARAIEFKPVIAPMVFSENGKPVYSPLYISRGFAVRKGICQYSSSLEDEIVAQRGGSRPLIIKGLKTDDNDSSKIIISSSDASKVLNRSDNLILLNQCRVVIITDFNF